MSKMREFPTGGFRNDDKNKIDPEAALSPLVLERYCEYTKSCRDTPLGYRHDDNWQKGFPLESWMKSMFRHFLRVWHIHRGWSKDDIETALCALLFNVMGYLHEILKAQRDGYKTEPTAGKPLTITDVYQYEAEQFKETVEPTGDENLDRLRNPYHVGLTDDTHYVYQPERKDINYESANGESK